MPTAPGPALVRDGLRQTWTSILDLLESLQPDDWARPTGCVGWSVQDVAAHMGGLQAALQGLAQPQPPEGFEAPVRDRFSWFSEPGVAARRSWSPEQVIEEARRAAELQLKEAEAVEGDGWDAPANGPTGPTTVRGAMETRVFDLYVHMLDIRGALGRPLIGDDESAALAVAVDQAVAAAPWAAVKRAGLADRSRVRVQLGGQGARSFDVAVEGGRGRLAEPPAGDPPPDRVEATAAAWLLLATGRQSLVDTAGGVQATGDGARRLVDRFRLFTP